MYVSEKAPGEVQITKLSQAIRIGSAYIPEDQWWSGCALGTAAQVHGVKIIPHWVDDSSHHNAQTIFRLLHSKFGISELTLCKISRMHAQGVASRERIAEMLEMNGQ